MRLSPHCRYLFVGDTSELVTGIALAYVTSSVVLTTGKTPLVTTVWAVIQSVFVGIEARLSVKSLLLHYLDPAAEQALGLSAGAPWEGFTEIVKQEPLMAALRVLRAALYVALGFMLLCRREMPKTGFDPRDHMPDDYVKEHGRRNKSKKVGDVASPNSPGVLSPASGDWAATSPGDDSHVPHEERFSNEQGGSICMRLMFDFITPLLVAGGRAALEAKQLFLLSGDDDAVLNARKLTREWQALGVTRKNSLIKAVLRLYRVELAGSGILMLLSIACTLAQPQVLYVVLLLLIASANDE